MTQNQRSHVKHATWTYTFFLAMVSALALLILSIGEGTTFFLFIGIFAIPVFPLVSFVLFKLIEKFTPIMVETDGISTYSFLGMRTFVRWNDVTKIKNFVLGPGLKWILLDDGRPYFKLACVPIFVKDRPAFYRDVFNSAGETHIVTQTLRGNGFQPE
jgi:hypothetical protein